MKILILTNGKPCQVSDEDYDNLSQYSWSSTSKGYPYRYFGCIDGKQKNVYMHRELLNATKGITVDHIDNNPLNNTRENLRLATYAENLANTGKQKNNTSGYKGVAYNKINNNWRAMIRDKYLGSFNTPREAAAAYNKAAIDLYGEFAGINKL